MYIRLLGKIILYVYKIICTWFNLLLYKRRLSAKSNCLIYKLNIEGGGKILLHNKVRLENCSFIFEGPNNTVEINSECNIHGLSLVMRLGGDYHVKIGSKTTVGGTLIIECSEGTCLRIGDDCMISHHCHIFTTDMHSIMNNDSNRINKSKDVIIGNHVWVGHSAMILKGSIIPNGSIIGASSVYSMKSNETNSVFAGNPAKKIKDNINWQREII